MPRPRRGRMPWPLLLTGALALGACGGGDDGGGGSSKELTYWSMWKKGEPQQVVLQRAIEAFKRDTGITVNVQWQGRDVIKKLRPALNTSKVPDLVDQDGNTVQSGLVVNRQHRELGGVYDATIPGEGKKVSDVVPGKLVDLVRDAEKQPFMVPYEVISSAIWFNAAEHPDVAKRSPATWEEFAALLDESKRDGRAPLAQDGDIGFYNSYWTYWAVVRVLGPGGMNKVVADKSGDAWKDPRIAQALAGVERLAKGGYFIDGYKASKWPAVQQKWARGDADYLLMGTWAPSETAPSAAKDFRYDAFQFPQVAGGSGDSAEAGVIGFSIPAKAKRSDAAERFIAYFLNRRRLSGIATEAKNLTPREDVDVPPELKTAKEAIESKPVHRVYDGVDADFPGYQDKVLAPMSTELVFGRITAQQFTEKIAEAQADYWKLNG